MIRFIRLLFLAILLPVFSFAQSNFKPGYIVTLKGDTIHGVIDLKDALYPREVTFKKELTGASQLFTANDITYFQIDNIIAFRKYTGSISADRTDITKITIGRDMNSEKVVIFLRLEQGGPNANLYSYADNTKTRYFIDDKQNVQPVELAYRVYYTSGLDSKTKTEEGYKAQLLELANKYATNSEGLLDKIEQAKYNVDDLRSITRLINNTKASKNVSGLSPFGFFIGFALNSTTFKPREDVIFPFLNLKSHTSVFPRISFGVNIYPNPAVRKLFVRTEISFTKNSYKTDVDSYADNRPLSKSNYAFDQYVFAFYPQLQYNLYNANNLKFYINGGVSINFSNYKGNTYRNNYTEQTTIDALGVSKTWLSVPVKAGTMIGKKFEAYVMYVFPTYSVSSIKATSMQAGIGYLFH